MESMKDKITHWIKSFQNYINIFHFVEKEKNIFYFSKFSLDIDEFFEIHNFIYTLKDQLIRENLNQFRYCVKDIIKFTDNPQSLDERKKVIVLYSACLYIYYKKFRFSSECAYEQYFDSEFKDISKTIFKFEIVNNEIFNVFLYFFFGNIQKILQNLDYQKIRNIQKYYNYSRIENKNLQNQGILNGMGYQSLVKNNKLIFLISAKEKNIDIVLESYEKKNEKLMEKNFPKEIKDMNNIFQKLNKNLNLSHQFENLDKNENENKIHEHSTNSSILSSNDNISENKSDTKSDMYIEECPLQPKTFNTNNKTINYMNKQPYNNNMNQNVLFTDTSNNSNDNNINQNNIFSSNSNSNKSSFIIDNNSINSSFIQNPLLNSIDSNINLTKNNSSNQFSKTVMSELKRSEFDERTMEIINEVSKILDEKYLDDILNSEKKSITLIQGFCCYIVEFTPEMLKDIVPQYKNIVKNFGIKFIVLAKDLYNITMEVFSTIYDLSYINYNNFMELTKNYGIQLEHAQVLYQ